MSELIDRNVLKAKMYQEAFESDTDMQKWDSECWIRYKLFEKVVDSTPTVPYAPRWHRCEDELPPAHENLLCCGSRGGMFVGWVLGSAVCICGSCTGFAHGGKCRQFTHWMPLPEPPKEDA